MSEENTPVTPRSGWLDRRVDRKIRKRQLERLDEREELRNKIDRRAERDALTRQRLSKVALATRTVMISGPILAPMAVAWTGQAGFAMKVIGWTFPAAIVYAAAYELTTAFCGWMYHEARKDGDSGIEFRLATWAFATGSATQQWWHYSDHWSATPRSVTFASMTMIGLMVWELYARLIHRRKLRQANMRTKPMPKMGLVRWVRFPRTAWTAWSEMVRTGTRDLDQAWSVAEVIRTNKRSARTNWFTRRTTPLDQAGPLVRADQVHEVGGHISTDRTADQLPPLPDHLVQPARTAPMLDQVRTTPELPPVPADQVQAEPTAVESEVAQPEEFEATETERRAIQYMIESGITINRRNVGEVIRTHDGFKEAINTTRAGRVAAWGRSQPGYGDHLKAV
jgi:hypothetical protein